MPDKEKMTQNQDERFEKLLENSNTESPPSIRDLKKDIHRVEEKLDLLLQTRVSIIITGQNVFDEYERLIKHSKQDGD